ASSPSHRGGENAEAMKYVDEYRNAELADKIIAELRRVQTRPWVIMEVCGGQTHSIVKHGIDTMLPETVELVHGPGCPVCVTPLEIIDKAHAIARRPEVIFCSFGDMLRVPGSENDLFTIKSAGADIRIVYSPLDCLKIARAHPEKKVVFFAVGFETTAPANAMAVWQAHKKGVKNFSILVSHVLVPPSIAAILQSPQNRVQAFLGPGHVCAVVGYREYEALSARYHAPRSRTNTRAPCSGKATCRRKTFCWRSSISATGNGAASAAFPKAATSSATSSATTTPRPSSRSRRSTPRSLRRALAGRFSRASKSRTIAMRSGRFARRGTRSARRWSRPRAPAPLITPMAGTWSRGRRWKGIRSNRDADDAGKDSTQMPRVGRG